MVAHCGGTLFTCAACCARDWLTGATTDYLVIGSDSGKIIILEWNSEANTWRKVHDETFGKTGVRRICPGQFLAVDPKGRAVIIGERRCMHLLHNDGVW